MKLNNVKVGLRLTLGFASVTLIALVVGLVGLSSQSNLKAQLDSTSSSAHIERTNASINSKLRDVRISVLLHIAATDQSVMSEQEAKLQKLNAEVRDLTSELTQQSAGTPLAMAARESETNVNAYLDAKDTSVIAKSRDGDKAGAIEARNTGPAGITFKAADTTLNGLSSKIEARSKSAVAAGADAYDTGQTETIILIVVGVFIAMALASVITRSLVKPIRTVVDALGKVALGDLTVRTGIMAKDEVGQMAASLDEAMGRTSLTMGGIAEQTRMLATTSTQLSSIASILASGAEETSAQASAVSSAAEEVSSNVHTVASATEEMGASVNEIASSASQASGVALEAVAVAAEASQMVGRLNDSSDAIGEIVNVITAIAEQTNLLALNAAIEAARAGDLGKGFAVVAGEVKSLAQETSNATAEIRRTVDAIQRDTGDTQRGIEKIGEIITSISDQQTAIASVVEEQSATTTEVAGTVNETAVGVSSIAENVSGVATAARETTESAAQTQESARELSEMSETLRGLVGSFRF